MTQTHRNTIALLAALGLVACSSDDSSSDDGTSAATMDTGADGADGADSADGDGDGDGDGTGGTGAGDDTGGFEPVVGICGIAHDVNGAVVMEPGVQFCGPVEDGMAKQCIIAKPEADGTFCADDDDPGDWNLKLIPAPGDRTFTGSAVLYTLNEGDFLDIIDTPIVITEVDTVTPLDAGAADIVIDDSLTVGIDPATSDFGLGVEPKLGGVAVPEAHWATDLAGDGMHVVAQWSFFPFGITATEGEITLTINSALGLAAGTAVNIIEMDKDIAEHKLATTGTVNAEGTGIDLDGGVHKLSWILVTTAD